MEALELEETPEAKNKVGKVSVLSKPDFCLGCGVCAYKCPTKSLKLVERETIHEPPKDARECTKLFYIQSGAGNKPK
jgi:NAD-dependent dihydropyrimidine dehydrogenase PreA subunit